MTKLGAKLDVAGTKFKKWLNDDTIDQKIRGKRNIVTDPTTKVFMDVEEKNVVKITGRLLFERDKRLTPIGSHDNKAPSFFTTFEKSFAVNQLVNNGNKDCKHRYLYVDMIEVFDKEGKTLLSSNPIQGFEVLISTNRNNLLPTEGEE